MQFIRYSFVIFVLLLISCKSNPTVDSRPNILIIIADDMGYSDLSYYGGEIPTPHIDALFEEGITLNQFYVSPSCSPTRAMLLSGADNHRVGLGTMIETMAPWQKDNQGYEGHLQKRVVTFADVLKENGYNNYLTGKWHLGDASGYYPSDRGFHESYAMLNGNSWHDGRLIEMPEMWKHNHDPQIGHVNKGQEVELPPNSYASDFYTDKMIEYIDGGKKDNKPFMAYLSLITPHFPLQAPRPYIEKYKGKYDEGYQAIAKARYDKLKKQGLIKEDIPLSKIAKMKPWESLSDSEKKYEARKMEVFAAMVEKMDENVGKIVTYLKDNGEYDNTVILFFADNGPAPQPVEVVPQPFPTDNSLESIGSQKSFVGLGPNWASVSSLPYSGHKGSAKEGGIRGVAAIKMNFKTDKKATDALIHISDVYPSLIDISESKFSPQPGAQEITGESFLPILTSEKQEIRSSFGMELSHGVANARTFRKGDFKLVWIAPPPNIVSSNHKERSLGKWKLFNIKEDPAETNDLIALMPDKSEELKNDFQNYVAANGVILPQ